jgi:hypothetical protein
MTKKERAKERENNNEKQKEEIKVDDDYLKCKKI